MTRFNFKDIGLAQAEGSLVHHCMGDEAFLRRSLNCLAVDNFVSGDVRDAFYLLSGWLANSTYEPETNEERLAESLASLHHDESALSDSSWWEDWLDALWSPWMAIDAYRADLLKAVADAHRLRDNARAAYAAVVDENPLQIDPALDDALYEHLREGVVTRRQERRGRSNHESGKPKERLIRGGVA